MTPRQKALQLVDSFTEIDQFTIGGQKIYFHDSIKCALIALDEIIKVACDESDYDKSVTKTYWQEVKQEIEKL